MKEDLKLLLLAAMNGDEFLEDRRKPNYQDWIENQVTDAIFNLMVAYVAILGAGVGSSDGSGKPELMQLMEKWRDGIALIKPKGGIHFQDLWRKTLQQRLQQKVAKEWYGSPGVQ